MIRRPPRSTPLYSSAASDVYKRQLQFRTVPQVVPAHLEAGPQGASRNQGRLRGPRGRRPAGGRDLRARLRRGRQPPERARGTAQPPRSERAGRRCPQPAVRAVSRYLSRHRPHVLAQRPDPHGREHVGRRPPEKKPLGPRAIDKAIVSFMDRAIGPDDLVAAMSPEMDASRLVFTRRPKAFEEWVATVWGRRFSWDDLDPKEEQWGLCYPPDDVGDPFGCFRGIFEEMVLRRREQLTLPT